MDVIIKCGTVFIIVFILFLVLVLNKVFVNEHLSVIESDIDNEYYLVREAYDKENAANMLAKIKENIFKLSNYLYENIDKYPEYKDNIIQLKNRIKNVEIMESAENSEHTSYSVNKGEKIVFCLRSKKENGKLHDINLLMYVVIHEMAHVACPEYGHTDLFKNIFTFLLKVGISIGLYTNMEFDKNPKEYCGMTITDSLN